MNLSEFHSCAMCPRECQIDRTRAKGYCQAGTELCINLAQLHFGEEPPISGTRGSGTIFFSHCNLRCVFCQNYKISLQGQGRSISTNELLSLFYTLQQQGAHNINLVTPTHYSMILREIIAQAKADRLTIPVLWNSSGYEKVSSLQQMKGLIDIYLPDFKYYHPVYAKKYSGAGDYPVVALNALREMVSQCGFLQLDAEGIAQKGVLVRLLVLPHALAGTQNSLRLLADEFGPDLPLSLMAQYYPAGRAKEYPELNRGITTAEYQAVLDVAQALGFTHIYTQELSSDDSWTPDFVTYESQSIAQTGEFK